MLVLAQFQKEKRKENCERWIADQVDWQKVVFLDENKFNLDGPDNGKIRMWKNEKLDRNNCQGGVEASWFG